MSDKSLRRLKRKPDDRVIFRDPGLVFITALKNFCAAEDRTISQVGRMALKQFLPEKYVAAARLAMRKAAAK